MKHTGARKPSGRAELSAEDGRKAEEMAAAYLEHRGWKVLARNYRCRYGELDIVARRGGLLSFVEVRYRRDGALASPLESLDHRKLLRIRRSAECYLAHHPGLRLLERRMDVILLEGPSGKPDEWRIEHVPSIP